LLAHFFRNPLEPGKGFYSRQLERQIGIPQYLVNRELRILHSAGVLLSWEEGGEKRPRKLYRLNPDFPIHEELRNIFIKTVGAGDIIRKHLSEVKGVELAFIYGSFAKGEERATSDIDVMVVGEASDMELGAAFGKMERHLHRQVNYSLFDRKEVKQRLREGIGFIPSVFSQPKVMIQGDPNDELLTRQPRGTR